MTYLKSVKTKTKSRICACDIGKIAESVLLFSSLNCLGVKETSSWILSMPRSHSMCIYLCLHQIQGQLLALHKTSRGPSVLELQKKFPGGILEFSLLVFLAAIELGFALAEDTYLFTRRRLAVLTEGARHK